MLFRSYNSSSSSSFPNDFLNALPASPPTLIHLCCCADNGKTIAAAMHKFLDFLNSSFMVCRVVCCAVCCAVCSVCCLLNCASQINSNNVFIVEITTKPKFGFFFFSGFFLFPVCFSFHVVSFFTRENFYAAVTELHYRASLTAPLST